jgi:hypothetical protein
MNKIALVVLVACMVVTNDVYARTSNSVECALSQQNSPPPNTRVFICDFPYFYLLDDGQIIATEFQKVHLTVTVSPGAPPQATGVLSFEYFDRTSEGVNYLQSVHLFVYLSDNSHNVVAGGVNDYVVDRRKCNYNNIWTPVVWSFAIGPGPGVGNVNFDSITFARIDGTYDSNHEGTC